MEKKFLGLGKQLNHYQYPRGTNERLTNFPRTWHLR